MLADNLWWVDMLQVRAEVEVVDRHKDLRMVICTETKTSMGR